MGRNRYLITEPDKPHFFTCTVVEWLPVFTRPQAVAILFDSWAYLRANEEFRLYGYVVMENHIHFIDHLRQQRTELLLDQLRFTKRTHKSDREYQFWQEGFHAELILSEKMMRQKLEYIHNNPVKRGYVERAEHWRYSSARNYCGQESLIEIDCW